MPARTAAAKTAADAQRTLDDAKKTVEAAKTTAADARTTIEGAPDVLPELARRAERVFYEGVDQIKAQAREKLGVTDEHLDSARLYVVERVQERPFTTTLAALGAGFLIGLLFAGKRR